MWLLFLFKIVALLSIYGTTSEYRHHFSVFVHRFLKKNGDICGTKIKCMAYDIDNDQQDYIEFSNSVVDYSEGDVAIFDHLSEFSRVYPIKPKTILIALCYHGCMSLKFGGKEMDMTVGDVLVCPPNIKMEDFQYENNFQCKVICLSEHIIQSLLRDKVESWNHVVYIDRINKIRLSDGCMEEIDFYYALIRAKLQNKHRAPQYQIMQSLLRALLLELCFALEDAIGVQTDQRLSQGKVLFNRFLSMISNNDVKRQPIAKYASELAITPKYLTMLCLKYSNKTASEWVIQYTTEDIRYYLKSSNLSIKEISAKLGFANMSHFGSYVRKHMHKSPSEFRHGK